MNRRLVTSAAALGSALVLALAGCSGSSTSSEEGAPAPAVSEASGEDASTADFSFTAPEGWQDATDSVPGFAPDAAWADPSPDGFSNNLNVLGVGAVGEAELVDVVEEGATELEGAGFTDVERLEPEPVADDEAGVLTAAGNQNGVDFVNRQYYLLHDGEGWVVTFSFAADTDPQEREELAQGVMATWSWAD